MSRKQKPFFAQTHLGPKHAAKHFWTLEEATEWLKERGGGTVKKRNAGRVQDPFVGEIRTWGVVADV